MLYNTPMKLEGLRPGRMSASEKFGTTGVALAGLFVLSVLHGEHKARQAANEVIHGELSEVERGILREENVVLYPNMNQDGTAYVAPERTIVNKGALDAYNKESGHNVSVAEAYIIGNNASKRVQEGAEAYDAQMDRYLSEPAITVFIDLPVSRKVGEDGLIVGAVISGAAAAVAGMRNSESRKEQV